MVSQTLNNLILKSPQDWPTGVGLPFVRIQGTVTHAFRTWLPRAKAQCRRTKVSGVQ